MKQELKALLITALGVMILTPDSLFIKLSGQDSFTVTFYRHISQFALVFAVSMWQMRKVKGGMFGQFRHDFKMMYPVLFFYPLGSLGFVLGTLHNSVASNLIIIASSPLIGAIMAVLFLGIRIRTANWVAIIGVLLGVGIVMQDDFMRGDFWGSMASLLCAVNLAAFYNFLRAKPNINITLTISLSSLVTALIVVPFMDFTKVIPNDSMAIMLFNGAVICGVSFYLTSLMAKYLSPEETLLLYLLETLFGPVWVWVFLGDQPNDQILLGGVVVVFMVSLWAAMKYRQSKSTKDYV